MQVLIRMTSPRNPTSLGQWGFLCLFLGVLGFFGGCSFSAPHGALPLESIVYSAAADSIGFAAFSQLSQAEQESRRLQARLWLERFTQEPLPEGRIQALGNAVGLAPDDPASWLQLAHLWRWLGDYLKTMDCLDSAATAVRSFDPQVHTWSKREMQRRTALARSWLHYDRGEWQQGLEWARAAQKASPGDAAVRQVFGLLAGHAGMRSKAEEFAGEMMRTEMDNSDIAWVRAAYWVSRTKYRQAFNLIMSKRPNQTHQAEYWREKGEIAEILGEFSRAENWYKESAYVLPFRDSTCLSVLKYHSLGSGSAKTELKIWLAFDRYYVTGSYSAFTNLAFLRFNKAKDSAEKDFWAGQVVNATGTLLRKGVDIPWAYRTRGLVFAYGNKTKRSISDLSQASDLLGKLDQVDPNVESTLGHLLLMKEDHFQALPHLEVAVEMNPKSSRVWQDLGLAQIMSGRENEGGRSLTRALELNPEATISWYNRGLLFFHQKKFSRAKADLETAARLAPDNLEVLNLLQKADTMWRKNQP